ncbi:MAG: hypothetical protein Q9M19_01235 [Mariprofundaceae bacterium]|nr:hypothetical protein [Mariprofundaceae bacterium]
MSEDASVPECVMKTYVMGAEYGAMQAIEALCHCLEFKMSEEQFNSMMQLISDKADAHVRFSLMEEGCEIEGMQVH